jgi:propanediol dehydratase large subunit
MKQSVAVASGSNETESFTPRDVAIISEKIKTEGINVLDVIKSLHTGGFEQEADNLLFLVKLRVSGDYLQTSAIIRDARVLSAINDPNNYTGPGTGYRPSEQRKKELADIREVLDRDEVLRTEALGEIAEIKAISYKLIGRAEADGPPNEVVVGISPAFGSKIFQTLAGHKLSSVLKALDDGITRGGAVMRLVKFWHTADTSFLGLSAARLSGSGIGIGIQAKGTAVIHHKSRLPHNNLELFSNAPITKLKHYEAMGYNAARYCLKELPDPVIVTTKGEALGARFHARVALIYAIETSMTKDNAAPELLDFTFLEAQS